MRRAHLARPLPLAALASLVALASVAACKGNPEAPAPTTTTQTTATTTPSGAGSAPAVPADAEPTSAAPAGATAAPKPSPTARVAPADATVGEAPRRDVAQPRGPEGDEQVTSGIVWHRDDYDKARAEARAAGKPLVLDFWAPWCHTCLSMKHTVLKAPGLAPYAHRFVWLAIDTDRPVNEAVTKRFPIVFWPTFFVVDPEDESVQARLQGGAPEATFRAFLDQGRSALQDKQRGSERIGQDSPLHHLRLAEQHVTAGRHEEAGAAYAQALQLGGADWPRRSDVLVAHITTLYKRDAFAECLDYARKHLTDAARGKTAAGADFAYFGETCGKKGKVSDEDMAGFRTTAAATIQGMLADPGARLSVDDRGDAMRIARGLLEALGRVEEAKAMARGQRDLLDGAAAAASTPYEAMTYSWPRCEVYAYLGEHDALVPSLQKLVEALPDEYDPPYRLAWLLHEAGRSVEALPHAKRARARVYGPRTKRVDSLIEKIEAAAKRKGASKKGAANGTGG